MEMELTQCRVFLAVICSPIKTWPRWPPQRLQTISVRCPSASISRSTAPGISSSKLGQPQPLENLSCDRYSGNWQRRQMKTPAAFRSVYSPVNARSVPLWSSTRSLLFVELIVRQLFGIHNCFPVGPADYQNGRNPLNLGQMLRNDIRTPIDPAVADWHDLPVFWEFHDTFSPLAQSN